MITAILFLMYGVAAIYMYYLALELIPKLGHPKLGIRKDQEFLTAVIFAAFFPIFMIVGAYNILRKKT